MEQKTPAPSAEPADTSSLESPDSDANALETPEPGGSQTVDATSTTGTSGPPEPQPHPKKGGIKSLLRRFNFYLLLFIFILIIAGGILMVAYFQSKAASKTSTLKTQTLTQNTLNQVANSDATVGNTQQVLNVQSSAVFAGKVLVRQDLEVAGSLRIGGTVGLTNLTVAGTTQLGQVQVNKDLSIAGDNAIQGAVTIGKSLQVSGSGNFSGPLSAPQITTSNFSLNNDLTLTHHIVAGGGTPGRSSGSALGSGGTSSVSGSDTAGAVTINTGSSPPAGCFVTVNFTQKYNNTPHILLTPVGSGAGGLAYYVNRTSTGFSICDATAPPSGTSFAFDYFVID